MEMLNVKNVKRECLRKITLKRMQPVLDNVLAGLKVAKNADNNVLAVSFLFHVLSKFSDQVFQGEYKIFDKLACEKERVAIANLQMIIYAMRYNNHHHISCVDAHPTLKTIFFGGFDNIPKLSLDQWLKRADDSKKVLRPDMSKNPSQPRSEWNIVNDYFCGGFVDRYVEDLFQAIAQLRL